ncbi:MAG: hypothetical protein JOY62_07875 [Acidobacteriaceae bacterium]|nr:hypothetical protein [Acidobacteriaceae bacterium]MBV9779878.1 hypothetical protein [Acidobacteriaceae bacterium]
MPENLESVLEAERRALITRRKNLFANEQSDDEIDRDLRNTLFGICFSGGGIRSATFNLGILQGLAGYKLLRFADYLSTVSGGGYIGSWFHGLVKREPYKQLRDAAGNNFLDYESYLSAEESKPGKASEDPITFLRKYSNYLSPQLGLLSPDTWVIGTIWLRNTILNQIILYLFIAAVLLMPLLIGNFARALEAVAHLSEYAPRVLDALILASILWTVIRIARNLGPIVAREFNTRSKRMSPDNDVSVWGTVIAPLWLISVLISFLIATGHFNPLHPLTGFITYFALLTLFGITLSHGGFWLCYRERHCKTPGWKAYRAFLAGIIAVVCALATFFLLVLDQKLVSYLAHTQTRISLKQFDIGPTAIGMWQSMSWGPAFTNLALAGGVALLVGLMGVDFPDAAREWYSRLSAKLVITGSLWASWFALAAFAPLGVIWLFQYVKSLGVTVVLSWIAATLIGVLSGKSSATSGKRTETAGAAKKSKLELLAEYAPPVALLGILIAISTISFLSVNTVLANFHDNASGLAVLSLDAHGTVRLTAAVIAIFVIALLLSARFNINEFSMSHFYKNRLVRCYLGASHVGQRRPNAFTGFDPRDDIPLVDLDPDRGYLGPFAIFNCALNLNHGSELAWQERKASSFVFTPKFCGYVPNHDPNGFIKTENFADPGGPHIGTATSISGAAANPNWGYHTDPTTAFLLTLFNVRLGWWIGNTRMPAPAATPGPRIAFKYLISELLGLTTEDSKYVNLSDGGHFENLGLYELARRKCRFIIVCDGEEDKTYQFESLGGAIRKIRIDFGHSVTISPKRIFLDGGLSQVHCATGTISYNDGSYGTLLYLKASLTGDETYDVTQYKKADPAFPHDSTLNQFFTESKFESYRALGKHVVEKVFHRVTSPQTPADLKAIFKDLKQDWMPPVTAAAGAFTKHASAYSELIGRLSESDNLRFLDAEVFPGFLSNPRPDPLSPEMRKAKLLIIDFIQLMEEVYLDLNLEDDAQVEHPENAGWIRLFQHWKTSPTFKEVWSDAGQTYGSAFRRFYERL